MSHQPPRLGSLPGQLFDLSDPGLRSAAIGGRSAAELYSESETTRQKLKTLDGADFVRDGREQEEDYHAI